MKLESLEHLFVEQLQDLYSAETQLVDTLPSMAQKASATSLQQAFSSHLERTKGHVRRLEEIFDEMGEAAKGPECKGMKGLIAEGDELLAAISEPEVLDAALIAIAQRIEHYEIAAYGMARTYADVLGQSQSSQTLRQALEEEINADRQLTALASRINIDARAA
jgi:ferritin-like metal-binding protein YciE